MHLEPNKSNLDRTDRRDCSVCKDLSDTGARRPTGDRGRKNEPYRLVSYDAFLNIRRSGMLDDLYRGKLP